MMVSLGCTSLAAPDLSIESFTAEQSLALSAPRLAGVQRIGESISVLPGGLTNISGYEWYQDGAVLSGETGDSVTPAFSGELSCRITADEGVLETASLCVRENGLPEQMMHDASLAIIPHVDATFVSKKNGDFSDPETWDMAQVPHAGAVVVISNGHKVTYDAYSAVRLDRMRVDGWLDFDKTKDTKLKVETLYVSLSGKLTIGESRLNPIPQGVTAEIEFSNRAYRDDPNMPGDLRLMGDMMLMGRGLIAHGEVVMYGAAKTTHGKVAAGVEPIAGDNFITLSDVPLNWQVGDEVDIVGTVSDMLNNATVKTTERRTIVAIAGNVVTLDAALLRDHRCANMDPSFPEGEKATLQGDVVNVTRNILLYSEDGINLPAHQRAHSMVMREDSKARQFFVAFKEMGRTDKSGRSGVIRNGNFAYADSVTSTAEVPLTADANVQSRYPQHFHFMGFGRAEEDRPIAYGCVVDGTPGWGMVHHGCDADFFWNAITGFTGAGMVSETADELGAWGYNIAYGGTHPQTSYNTLKIKEDGGRGKQGDFARGCYPFFMRGRSMRIAGNIAADAPHGFVFYPRENGGDPTVLSSPIDILRDSYDISDLAILAYKKILFVDAPIIHFADNEAYGVCFGLEVTKEHSAQKHDLNIELKRLKTWNCFFGTSIEYIGSYALSDFESYFLGTNTSPSGTPYAGVDQDRGLEFVRVEQVAITRPKTVGFYRGIELISSGLQNRKASGIALTTDDFDINDWRFAVTDHVNIAGRGNGAPIRYETGLNENTGLPPNTTCQDVTAVLDPAPPETLVTLDVPFIYLEWDGGPNRTNVSRPSELSGVQYYKRDSYTESFVEAGGGTPGRFAADEPGIAKIGKVWDHAGVSREQEAGTQLQDIAASDGYWTYNGDNILLVPLYFSDRLYATPHKFVHAVRCTGNMSSYASNGEYTRSPNAPTVAPLSVVTTQETQVIFNALETTIDPDAGNMITLERSFYAPDHGRATLHPDTGMIEYTPDAEYVGNDRMLAFAYDGAGGFGTVKINITVQEA